jgi:hypothetical protein
VKLAPRAAIAALITTTAAAAVAATLLSSPAPGLASQTPPTPHVVLSGTRANTNPATSNVAGSIVIGSRGSGGSVRP